MLNENILNDEIEVNFISKIKINLKKYKSRKCFLLFFLISLFAFNSCSTYTGFHTLQNVNVKLDVYSNKENVSNEKVALLICNDGDIPKHDLKNLELESYIKKMLAPQGCSFTSNNNEANIVIFYEYGISDPKVYTSQKVIPIWGQTGIASSKTENRTSYLGKSYAQTTYTPSYGKIGERVENETEITYIRWVNISAFDADYYRKTGEDKMIWLAEIQSKGSSDDLRFIFPYMMVAAKEYVGQNHTNKITVEIPSNPVDKRVLELKGALATVIINQATTGRKDPQATIYEDVYKNGNLFIKSGTSVQMEKTRVDENLLIGNFSTTSVYGNNIALKGGYAFEGIDRADIRYLGMCITLGSFFILSPFGIPLWCIGDAHAKIPEGTLLYLEVE